MPGKAEREYMQTSRRATTTTGRGNNMLKGGLWTIWEHRIPIMARIVTSIALALLIGSIFFSGGASAQPVQPVAGRPGPVPVKGLKKLEGNWFQLSHVGKSHVATDAYLNAATQASSMPVVNATTKWVQLGPKPINAGVLYSGRVTAEAVNPSNTSEVWVGGADGGLWHSTNGGSSWTAVYDKSQTIAVGSIALDPTTPTTIYVGTGEANFNGDAYWGVGVLKSTDGGTTWTRYGFKQFGGLSIGRIAVDPTNTQVLLLSAMAQYYPAPTGGPSDPYANMGIWRSTNGGQTWKQVLTGGASNPLYGTDVVFDPANPNIAFAGLGAGTGAGVYKSTNNGQTWTLLSSGIPTDGNIFRIGLGISSDGTHVYAVMADNAQTDGGTFGQLLNSSIYASTNTGSSWTAINVSGVSGMVNDDGGNQWWYDLYAAVDPTNSSTVYVGGVDIWQTSNGGSTWTNLTNAYSGGSVHPDQHAFAFKGNTSSYFIGNDGGVWSGTSSGSFTDRNTGLSITQFYGGSIGTVGSDSQLYGGAQDNGEDQYPVGAISGAKKWTEVFGGDGGDTVVDYTNNATVYEEYVYLSMNKSTDGGNTWNPSTSGINSSDPVNFIAPFIMSPNNHNELFAGTDRVYKTTNGASSWSSISPVLDGGAPLSAMAVAPGNDNVIYAGDNNGNVYVTTNGGTSWSGGAVTGSTGGQVRGLAVDPSNPNIVYASFANFATGSGHHVFKSTNSGTSWTDISAGLPNIPSSSILALSGRLIVGNDTGVYTSTDGGSTWAKLGSGLPMVAVDQVFADPTGTEIFLATHGRGMWMITL